MLTNKSVYPYLNRILLVLADPEQQITRIMARDHCSRDQASALLATTRADDDKRRLIADDIVVNDASMSLLQIQAEQLHAQYLLEAKAC